MPPLRRGRSAAWTPYASGWLRLAGRRRRRRIIRRSREEDGDRALPGDVLAAIISRASSSAADASRLAATCARWAHAVATRADAVCRSLPLSPGRFLPNLALGFFHGPPAHNRSRRRGDAPEPPRLVPTESGSRLLRLLRGGGGAPDLSLDHDDALLLDRARPVASRNGRVLLQLRRASRGDGLTLAVCNPMSGELSVLPALSGADCPGHYYSSYACAMLTGDDLGQGAAFFRVLLVYNRRSFTALRSCSSGSGWGRERRKPGAKMSARTMRLLCSSPAVVVRGVAYWPTHHDAFGVRLDGEDDHDTCLVSVPYSTKHIYADDRLLGVSPDGTRLTYISVSFVANVRFTIDVETHYDRLPDAVAAAAAAGGDRRHRRQWVERREDSISLPELRVARTTALRLRWFGERSGTVLFTVGEGGGCTAQGAFALNLATRRLQKLADGAHCHAWRDLCGYDMDRAALLASLARF